MIFVVVGDAQTQLEPLRRAGMGSVILVDREARLLTSQ